MTYQEARAQIKTGDLIAVRDVHSVLGKMTRYFTRSPYTHTGIAVWLGDRLFMADLNSGRNHLTAISQLDNFDVFEAPAGLRAHDIEIALFDWLAKPITYGYLAFLAIGLKCYLGMNIFIHWRKIIVCSGGSVQIYENAGWSEHSRMVSPGELTAMVGPIRAQVRLAT